jgi:hypothetical protein
MIINKFYSRMGKRGISAEAVAKKVAHALTSKRPNEVYLIGKEAWMYTAMDGLFPPRLKDWLVLRITGLNKL